ncbi:MAG: sterol desaturase family protein [Myxococcota bacterium]
MFHPYAYPIALVIISLGVALAEFLWPWRPQQRQLRRTLWSDLMHLVFNGHFLGVIVYGIAVYRVLPHVDALLEAWGLSSWVYRNAASGWPVWLQIVVLLFGLDFIQWGVHRLLHQVPWLWQFHKTHHSVVDGEMDWIVSFRFQWTEVVVYKAIQYLPLAFFGFGYEAVMFHAMFGTLIGHLNHSNLDLGRWWWWRYILNSPRMHIWHHDRHPEDGRTVNFGIVFSIWDWVFGTAKIPEGQPEAIGFDGVEAFPNDFLGHTSWPIRSALPPGRRWADAVAAALGLGLLALGWWAHLPPG